MCSSSRLNEYSKASICKYCLVQSEKNYVNANGCCDSYSNDGDGDDDDAESGFLNCWNAEDAEKGCLIGEVEELAGLMKGECLLHRVLFSMKEVCLLKCIYDHLRFPLKKHW